MQSRVELRGAADGVEVDRAALLQRGERLRAHAALADDGAHAVAADHVGLVGLLANAGGRARRHDLPPVAFLQHDRTAVVEDRAAAGPPAGRASSGDGARRRGRCTCGRRRAPRRPPSATGPSVSSIGARSTCSLPARGRSPRRPARSSDPACCRVAIQPARDAPVAARRARRRAAGTPSSRRRPTRRSSRAAGSARRSCTRSATRPPPNPIGPDAERVHRRHDLRFELGQALGTGFTSSSVRNSCSFACR